MAAQEEADVAALAAYLEERADDTGNAEGLAYRPWIAVLPFIDVSGFRDGVWDLRHGPGLLLSRRMAASPVWRVVPYAAVRAAVRQAVSPLPQDWDEAVLADIARRLHVDLLVVSRLLDYNMERLTAGDPLLGGYKSYRGEAEIEAQVLRVAAGTREGMADAVEEVIDRGLGIDLLGKPREQDVQFANLHLMEYGGDAFQGTAIGQATVQVMDKVVAQLAKTVRPQALHVGTGAVQILSVFGDEVFVNVGSENGVHVGYRFAVYPGLKRLSELEADQLLGVVEVTQIIGARVSRVIALSGGERMAVGDRLELVGVESE